MAEHSIPGSLIDRIRAGRAALVVGSSFGALAGLPSWKKLLERLREELAKRGKEGDKEAAEDVAALLKKGRLVSAAGFLARQLGGDACDNIVAEAWKSPETLPETAKVLGRLPLKAIWTTQPGDLIEKVVAAGSPSGWPDARVATYATAGDIDPRRRYVLKLLGDVNDGSFVVVPTSVRRALSSAQPFRKIVGDMYGDASLLFVGFRHGDPDLQAILDRLFSTYEPPTVDHYFAGSGLGPVDQEELHAEHHISAIPLEGQGGDEKSSEALVEFLNHLAAECEKVGLSLATTRPAEDDLEGWLERLAQDNADTDAKDAIVAIENRARDAGDWEKVVDALMGRVEAEHEATGRAAILREVARIFEEKTGDLPRAFTALTAALREDPTDEDVITAAERLAAETDGWGELVADLSEAVPAITDKKVAAGIWVRLGRWYADKLRHDDYAVASYREALKLDTRRREAREGLEELYRKQQKWGELASELSAHADVEDEAGRRVDVLLALGDLYETQLASTAKAIDAYEKALDADKDNDDALAALERLYRRGERWGKLAGILEKRAEHLELNDPTRAAAIRKELGTLRSEKLGDVEGAIGRYEAALNANPRDVDALKSLEKLYEKLGRTDDYLRTLERLAEVGPENERAATYRRLAAEVEDREGGAEKATRYYEALLGLEPNARDAYRSLDRLYRASQRWDEAVRLLERQISTVTEAKDRVELWASLGRLQEQELQDPHRAIEAYQNAIDITPDHKDSLTALARLYKRVESWDKAVATLGKLAEAAGPRGADLWHDAAMILSRQLDDAAEADKAWNKALALDAGHLPSILAMIEQAKRNQDYARAAHLMIDAEHHSHDRQQKVQLLFDAARLWADVLEQPDKAADLYARVLALDPEHVEAGLRAVERWIARENWDEAEPVLEMLARKVDPEDTIEKARRHALLGKVAEALGHGDKAAKHYRIAVENDPESLEASFGLAGLLYAKKEWADAEKHYRDLLARHRPSLPESQLIDVWHRIGVAAKSRGEVKAAEGAFRRALEHDPRHRPTLRHVIELATAKGDWKAVVEAKRAELEGAGEDERFKLLDEIGDLYAQNLEDPVTALGAYLEGLTLRPRSHQLLHKTLEIYTEQKQWRRALETLSKLAEIDKDPGTRAKYWYAAAVVARDEIKDADEAVEFFTRALDDAPSMSKAFDAIERILGERQDWKGLVRAYRKMIKRVADRASEEQLLTLWTRLGETALEKIGDREAAMAALEVAATLEPGNVSRHEQLARLYLEAGPDRADKAAHELQILLKRSPDRLDLYKSLAEIYEETGQVDKAYCLAQALTFLGQASDEDKAIIEAHRPKKFALAKRRLTEELWQKNIIHPREDRVLSGIFASLTAPLAATTGQPHAALELDPAKQTDPEKDPHLVARMFRYAVQTLGITPAPELYLRPGHKDGIRAANIVEKGELHPAVLIGEPYIGKKNERDVAFDVAKKLVYFRPERYVYFALPTMPKLEAAFEASLVAAGVINGKREADVEKLASHLKRTVPGSILEHVTVLAKKMPTTVASVNAHAVVGGWVTAADLTANRVGLILANDLETAARMVATEQNVPSTLSAKERLRELLAYAVSEEYFAVRKHLGLDVGPGAGA